MTLAPMETTPEQQMGAQLAAGSRLNLSSEACPEQTATAECAAEQVSQGHRKGRRQNGAAGQKVSRSGRGGRTLDGSGLGKIMRILIRSAIRHEQQLTILEADRSYVFFMETNSHGIIGLLTVTQASATWHQKFEEGTVRTSLRATLWGVILMERQACLEKIEKDTQVLQVAETAGWATRTPLQWIYNEWNPEQKK